MTERTNGDQTRPRKFFTLFMVLSMKWVIIVFPAALIIMLLMSTFAPNAFSAVPEWVGPVIVAVAPFTLGLTSACWAWRRGDKLSTATEPRIDGSTWLFSALASRWLYLIVLPVFIVVVVLLGAIGVVVPSRLIFVIGLGVVLLLLGLRLADGLRRLRQP